MKVDGEAKARLEELQAEIRLAAGKKVTQQEPLSRLIDDAYASREAVVGTTSTISSTTRWSRSRYRERAPTPKPGELGDGSGV